MPSVGSTPTSSPAVTSAFSQPANCQQISFNSFLQHRHSSVSNMLSDTTQTASTTTSSTSSTPFHSPQSHTSLDSMQSNQPYINTTGGIINPLSQQQLNISQMVVATISNDNTNNQSNSIHHHHNNQQKYSKFMIITPAVSIDRNFDSETGAPATNNSYNDEQSNYLHYCYNLNTINNNSTAATTATNFNTNSINNDNYLRSNYNSTTINDNNQSNQRLLSKTANGFYRSSSWRWCTFICAAMRCFGGGRNTNAPYTTTFSRKYTPLYSDESENSRRRSSSSSSSGTKMNFTTNRLLRNHNKNKFNNYEQPYTTPRKTRDHLNNITYEL